ncbi:MAG: hypothetical protein WDO18_04895 [Acidobacteriota bacterium]
MKLNFQIRSGLSGAQQAELEVRLKLAGAERIYRLFPQETDPELASLHVAETQHPEPRFDFAPAAA